MDFQFTFHQNTSGSTNATLMSLHGTDDLTTAALHIALGDNSGLDVLAVHDGETGAFLRYTVSLLGYGFHGDLLEPSENLRWMGPDRYNVAGALNFLRLASYYGRVSYLPSRTSAHPLDATVCHAACKICAEALEDPPIAPADKPAENPMPDSIDVRFPSPVHEPTSPTFIPSDSDEIHVVRGDKANTHEDAEESYHSNSEIEVSVNHKNKCKGKWLKRFLSKSDQALPLVDSSGDFNLKPGWESVTGSFIAINAFPISCRCVKSPQGPAPSAHLGDGCLDLILVHKCSHHEFLQYLVLLTNAKSSGASAHHPAVTAEHLKLPFVEVHRVHAMEFTPLDRNNRPLPACTPSTMYDSVLTASLHAKHRDPNVSVWCVDGEILRQAHVFCRMHRQLVRVFGRGPED